MDIIGWVFLGLGIFFIPLAFFLFLKNKSLKSLILEIETGRAGLKGEILERERLFKSELQLKEQTFRESLIMKNHDFEIRIREQENVLQDQSRVLAEEQGEKARIQVIELSARISDLDKQLSVSIGAIAQKEEQLKKFEKFSKEESDRKGSEIEQNKLEHRKLVQQHLDLSNKFSALEARNKNLEENFRFINDSLLPQFKNIANNVLNEQSERFSKDSQQKIDVLTQPLKERLEDFQKRMSECFDIDNKEKFSLKESIKSIITSNDQIRTETSKLANVLGGNRLALGHWGEIVLQNILEASGLRPDLDYFSQATIEGAEASDKQKPDILVRLPEERFVIIDSKVAFFDYEKYERAENKTEREAAVKTFIQRLKMHIEALAEKKYHSNGLNSPELTLMFIPIESWYSVALRYAPDLHSFAWSKNICLVCPPGLFAILKTVAYIWKGKLQAQNAVLVAKSAGKIYDQLVDFVEILAGVGKLMERSYSGYEKAMNKLSSGRGSIISKVEKIKELGINNTKSFSLDTLAGTALDKNFDDTQKLETEALV